MKRRNSLSALLPVLVCATLTATGLPDPAQAAERLRVATQYAEDHPTTVALNQFKDRVEEESDGQIKVRIFPANQLGDYTQIYEELRRGTIEMGLISVPSQFDPRLEVIYLHYLAMNYGEAEKIYAPGSALFQAVEKLHSDLGVKFLGFNVEGFGGLGLTKMPDNAHSPEQAKGILLRVPPMAVFKTTADDQGFQTVSVPFAELYTALQTGVADGWSGGPPLVNYLQFRDVIKYFLVNNNFFENTSYLISQEKWDELSAEDQALIQAAVDDLAKKSFEIAKQSDQEYLDKMKADNIEVIALSDEELTAWATHAREVTWPKLEERLSKELIESLQTQY